MKIKNKGKVYPTPSSSSSSSPFTSFSVCPNDGDVIFSVLKLLPAAILALATVLSLEDREVLAYMITRSLKTSSATSSSLVQESKKKSSKKASSNNTHKPPVFDCDCFDCYRSYWFRWDSSPNRELIHQVIEAFEDHLTNGEKSKKNGGRGKKREKMGRRETPKPINDFRAQSEVSLPDNVSPEVDASLEKDIVPMALPERGDEFERNDERVENEAEAVEKKSEEDMAVVVRTAEVSNHRGLARKVLPDVLGLLNSRFWSLWNPNV